MQKSKVHIFNELLTCHLCQGYLIEPTTIDICLHTYCRSCILKYLQVKSHCPQCGEGGRISLSYENLKCDNILRAVIYKLIPDLYNKEQECMLNFWNTQFSNCNLAPAVTVRPQHSGGNEFFSPTDPISLSLEYHPVLVKQCHFYVNPIPPMRYLQCPASLNIIHLKRFICSKYNMDFKNRYLEVHVMYEDESLPNNFSLIDVAYCYEWKRHAPMKFTYTILIQKNFPMILSKARCALPRTITTKQTIKTRATETTTIINHPKKEVSLNDQSQSPPTSVAAAAFTQVKTDSFEITKIATTSTNTNTATTIAITTATVATTTPLQLLTIHKYNNKNAAASLKMRKGEEAQKERLSDTKGKTTTALAKYTNAVAASILTNDFKSLRSNNIKYNNRLIELCDDDSSHSGNQGKSLASIKNSEMSSKCSAAVSSTATTATTTAINNSKKCTYDFDDDQVAIEDGKGNVSKNKMNVKLSHNPVESAVTTTTTTTTTVATIVSTRTNKTKTKNIPKLKIELNNLKTKLIEKPKSADIRLDTLFESRPNKCRKISLDDCIPTAIDRIDLKTYAKNIGLRPIEIKTNIEQTVAGGRGGYDGENNGDKCTPNASPMSSSSSSSTTSSSNSNANFINSMDINDSSTTAITATTSYHKKRKKKHSKELKESSGGSGSNNKRKKLHAEISSNSLEQSLKMKVKLTPPHTAKYFNKPHDTKKLHSLLSPELDKLSTNLQQMPLDSNSATNKETTTASFQRVTCPASKQFNSRVQNLNEPSLPFAKTIAAVNIKEPKLPSSPPLPPSLFKTTPLTFTTFSTSTSVSPTAMNIAVGGAAQKHEMSKSGQVPKPLKTIGTPTGLIGIKKSPINMVSIPYKNSAYFAMPHPPKTYNSGSVGVHTSKLLGMPASIASEANKQIGNILKRSVSMDESTVQYGGCNARVGSGMQTNAVMSNNLKANYHHSGMPQNKHDVSGGSIKKSKPIPVYSPRSTVYEQAYTLAINMTKQSDCNNVAPLPSIKVTSTSMTTKNKNKIDMSQKSASPSSSLPSSSSPFKEIKAKAGVLLSSSSSVTSNKNVTMTSNSTLMGPPPPVPRLIRKSSLTGLNVIPTAAKSPPLGSVLSLNSTKASTNLSSSALKNTLTFLSPLGLKFCSRVPSMSTPKNETISSHFNKILTSDSHVISTNTKLNKIDNIITSRFNAAYDKPKSTLRDFRLPARSSTSLDILDLTASSNKMSFNKNCNWLSGLVKATPTKSTTETTATTIVTSAIVTPSASAAVTASASGVGGSGGLELALKKIKQNTDSINNSLKSNNNNKNSKNNSSNSINNTNIKLSNDNCASSSSTFNKVTTMSSSSSTTSPNYEDLLNLQMLSDSAIAREKVAIPSATMLTSAISTASITALSPLSSPSTSLSTSSSSSPSSTTSLSPLSTSIYDKSKMMQNSLVRQQNASVRNIPNPSALAFRNQQPILVPLITMPPDLNDNESYITSDSGNTTTLGSSGGRSNLIESLAPLSHLSMMPPPSSPLSISSSTITIIPPTITTVRPIATVQNKKHATIDEVAATLNIRAAAAEAFYKANSATGKLNARSNKDKPQQQVHNIANRNTRNNDNNIVIQEEVKQQQILDDASQGNKKAVNVSCTMPTIKETTELMKLSPLPVATTTH